MLRAFPLCGAGSTTKICLPLLSPENIYWCSPVFWPFEDIINAFTVSELFTVSIPQLKLILGADTKISGKISNKELKDCTYIKNIIRGNLWKSTNCLSDLPGSPSHAKMSRTQIPAPAEKDYACDFSLNLPKRYFTVLSRTSWLTKTLNINPLTKNFEANLPFMLQQNYS